MTIKHLQYSKPELNTLLDIVLKAVDSEVVYYSKTLGLTTLLYSQSLKMFTITGSYHELVPRLCDDLRQEFFLKDHNDFTTLGVSETLDEVLDELTARVGDNSYLVSGYQYSTHDELLGTLIDGFNNYKDISAHESNRDGLYINVSISDNFSTCTISHLADGVWSETSKSDIVHRLPLIKQFRDISILFTHARWDRLLKIEDDREASFIKMSESDSSVDKKNT